VAAAEAATYGQPTFSWIDARLEASVGADERTKRASRQGVVHEDS